MTDLQTLYIVIECFVHPRPLLKYTLTRIRIAVYYCTYVCVLNCIHAHRTVATWKCTINAHYYLLVLTFKTVIKYISIVQGSLYFDSENSYSLFAQLTYTFGEYFSFDRQTYCCERQ